MSAKQYLCVDLKSFYASVECVERGLDPMAADLVVADPERTDKTICLAVSPSLKARGVSGRARVFGPRACRRACSPRLSCASTCNAFDENVLGSELAR